MHGRELNWLHNQLPTGWTRKAIGVFENTIDEYTVYELLPPNGEIVFLGASYETELTGRKKKEWYQWGDKYIKLNVRWFCEAHFIHKDMVPQNFIK